MSRAGGGVSLHDREVARQLLDLLAVPFDRPLGFTLHDAEGVSIMLTAPIIRALVSTVDIVARGEAVTVLPSEETLTTQAAADLLNVSRQYLVRLLDRGDIPSTKTGAHRRVRAGDVEAYRQTRDQERARALEFLVDQAQAEGGYDAPMGFGPART